MRVSAGVFAAGLLALSATTPASAGFFERLFGGFRHHGVPSNAQSFADPFTSLFRGPSESPARSTGNPGSGYCVRTSDGFYFPVRAQAGVSAAAVCHSFCPASETRFYSGGGIDDAVAADGSRYDDLDTAFLYRKELVAGSTCNGRDPFGLARMDVKTDPTLRPGDIVATKTGLMAFTGMNNKVADFAPLDSYRGVPKSSRDKLAGVKIMPVSPGTSSSQLVTLTGQGGVSRNAGFSAQAAR